MDAATEGSRSADILPLVLLLGRPASGKSEIIDYLQRRDRGQRRRLHVGRPVVLDDFPLLWAWLEEDNLLETMGKPRLHTTADGTFSQRHLWDVLVRRLCLEYDKLLAGSLGCTRPARSSSSSPAERSTAATARPSRTSPMP